MNGGATGPEVPSGRAGLVTATTVFMAVLAGCSAAPPAGGAQVIGDAATVGADGPPVGADASDVGSAATSEAGGNPEAGADADAASLADAGLSGGNGLPNCAGLPSTCGPAGNESCCATLEVPGGTFSRSYDAVTYTDPSFTATVSTFELDRFLVTVGRMRSFVTAVETGWLPTAGSGKHAHLNAGGGVNGGTESGWDATWNAVLASSRGGWDDNLLCDPTLATWTSSPGANEQLPVNCVEWEEAYAFCIWDGGFLPSEAEWNYAAAGGSEQRVYPWSTPPTSTVVDCSYVNFTPGAHCASPVGLNAVGTESPKGDGKWGHADLVGNVWEWQLDFFATPYAITPCTDCADLSTGGIRSIRSGSFADDASFMAVSYRHNYSQSGHNPLFSVRCARAP